MQIIDAHQHYYMEPQTIENLIEKSKMADITKVCLSGLGDYSCDKYNEDVRKAIEKYPDTIIGFGFIRLGIDTWHLVDELFEQGFRGLKTINPRKNYSDKEYYPIYKRAEELNMPILFHTGIKIFSPQDVKHDVACERMRPIFLDAVARAFPRLNIIGAHLGVPWYNEACAVSEENPNVYFDLSGAINILYKLEPWFFKILTYWEMAKGKFVFGVDDHYERIPEAVNKFNILMDKLNFSQELREKIFYGNMEKILGL
ncbi:MAG TPA: amidohydrolase family protein [Clostridiales bacterium]|nr:amidohydrolase family protein [Clostridiales bacterium]